MWVAMHGRSAGQGTEISGLECDPLSRFKVLALIQRVTGELSPRLGRRSCGRSEVTDLVDNPPLFPICLYDTIVGRRSQSFRAELR